MIWSLSAYLLLFFGLFSQQCVDFRKIPIEVSVQNLQWKVLLGSAVVAVALFPLFTHWFNSKRKKPSWEHVLWAFSFGFFVNLSSKVIWAKFF
jgi:RsiW-degrading membrane proteinase PrsW (M82 family)